MQLLSGVALGFLLALALVHHTIVPSLKADVTITDFDKGTITLEYTDFLNETQTIEVPSTVGLSLPSRAYRYGVKQQCE